MNELYVHQLETENKQLRITLQECRKALEEEITAKKKAIEYIKTSINNPQPFYKYIYGDEDGKAQNLEKLLEILGGKENE